MARSTGKYKVIFIILLVIGVIALIKWFTYIKNQNNFYPKGIFVLIDSVHYV